VFPDHPNTLHFQHVDPLSGPDSTVFNFMKLDHRTEEEEEDYAKLDFFISTPDRSPVCCAAV